MSELNGPVLVIDNGGNTIKAGAAGDDIPSVVLPTVVGRSRVQLAPDAPDKVYCGAEALQRRAILRLRHPIENKMVTNWDDLELIWHHLFYNELKVAPEEHAVLLTYPSDIPQRNKSKLIEIMYETFNVSSLYLGDKATLALYSAGKTTGVVVDIGGTGSLITPIYEVRNFVVSGWNITEFLLRLLSRRGYCLNTSALRLAVEEIKKQFAFCSLDFDADMQLAQQQADHTGSGEIPMDKIEDTLLALLPNELLTRINDIAVQHSFTRSYKLPDDTILTLGSERFHCAEILFSPSMIGMSAGNLVDDVTNSIFNGPPELRQEWWSNVVLSGGSTLFPGLAQRLEKELINRASSTAKVRVFASPARQYAAWVGGSMLASTPDYVHKTVSRDGYHEHGPDFLSRTFC